jgi:hypothetical protein
VKETEDGHVLCSSDESATMRGASVFGFAAVLRTSGSSRLMSRKWPKCWAGGQLNSSRGRGDGLTLTAMCRSMPSDDRANLQCFELTSLLHAAGASSRVHADAGVSDDLQ